MKVEGSRASRWLGPRLCAVLALMAAGVHGYHPYSEDGGLYAAGIKWLLDPNLYPVGREFVTEHLRFSIYARVVAGIVHGLGLSLPWVLLLSYVASLWIMLYAVWRLIAVCVDDLAARVGAVVFVALTLTVPVAGTSLVLVDPYLTARSFSTSLILLALAEILGHGRRRWLLAAGWLGLAALLHPLMAGYGFGAVLLLGCCKLSTVRLRVLASLTIAAAAVLLSAVIQASAPAESAAYLEAARSRYYWFPALWHWYEWVGLVGPLAVVAGFLAWARRRGSFAAEALCWMVLALGSLSVVVGFGFAREVLATHLVARLQPLRCFTIVYVVMLSLLGAWAGMALRTKPWVCVVLAGSLASGMFLVQRGIYPASDHVELPWLTPRNPWVRGFDWIRVSTESNAVFAIDADYITSADEDAQCFRAFTERSVLADYSKDGGEASITPGLTAVWLQGQTAQDGLSSESDAVRHEKLEGLGVTWVVLRRQAQTALSCAYENEAMKVCRLE